MPRISPNITVSASDYVNTAVLHTFELGHDDILFETRELNTSLKEIMNRIYKLELDVYELKQQLNQGGTISL